MAAVRWKLTDGQSTYVFEINPNEGGTPTITKQISTNVPMGPNRRTVFSEGRLSITDMNFGGVILTQTQLEAMELWALKRTLLQLDDDLGRTFQGVLSSFSPTRSRRAFNPWYHTFTATFGITAMRNASGAVLYGVMEV